VVHASAGPAIEDPKFLAILERLIARTTYEKSQWSLSKVREA
jgi:hypothetical protein